MDFKDMVLGKTQKYQVRGEVKPYVTNDPNDKRIQAYTDSLKNYNAAVEFEKLSGFQGGHRLLNSDEKRQTEDFLRKYLQESATGKVAQTNKNNYTSKKGIKASTGDDGGMNVFLQDQNDFYYINPVGDKGMRPVQEVIFQEKPVKSRYVVSREAQLPNVTNAQILRQLLFHNNYNLNPVEGVDYTLDKNYKDVNTKITDQDIAAWNKTFGVEPYTKELTEDEAKEMEKQGYSVKKMHDGGPTEEIYPIQTVVKQGKSKWFTPGWWNKQAGKLDNIAFASGFVPVVGDVASFLADVGANFARYQYDKNNPYLPEEQRNEIAKSNLKSGMALAGAGALMGLAGISMPSGKLKNAAKLNFRSVVGDAAPKPEAYSHFDTNLQISDLPEYAQFPHAVHLRHSDYYLNKRFDYKDWLERMEGRELTDAEFNELKKKYPNDLTIKRDTDLLSSYVDDKNVVHVGEEGIYPREVEQLALAHEKDHALGIPHLSENEINSFFGPIPNTYLKDKNATEMFARLGQVANWYGLTNIRKQPLTGDMLKYAAQQGNYVKSAKVDNGMLDFFNILKNNNTWESAAKAYNQYGKTIVPPALLIGTGAAAYNRLNKKDERIKFQSGGNTKGVKETNNIFLTPVEKNNMKYKDDLLLKHMEESKQERAELMKNLPSVNKKEQGYITQGTKDYSNKKDWKSSVNEMKAASKGWLPKPGTPEYYSQGIEAALWAVDPMLMAGTKVAEGVENGIFQSFTPYESYHDFVNQNINNKYLSYLADMSDPAYIVGAGLSRPLLKTVKPNWNKNGLQDIYADRLNFEQTHPTININENTPDIKRIDEKSKILTQSNIKTLHEPAKKKFNVFDIKLNDNPTFGIYTELVDKYGNVNNLMYDQILRKNNLYDPLQSITVRRPGEPTRLEHMKGAAKIAKELPYLPEGVTRQDAVTAALLHDIGYGLSKDGYNHANKSVDIINKDSYLNKFVNNRVKNAIASHMNEESFYGDNLSKVLTFADVTSNRSIEDAMTYAPHLLQWKNPDTYISVPNVPEDEELKNINKWLISSRYKTIPLKNSSRHDAREQLENRMRQNATFLRGINEPYINNQRASMLYPGISEKQKIEISANNMKYVPNKILSGRVGLDHFKSLMKQHNSNVDAIYTSNMGETANYYSHNHPSIDWPGVASALRFDIPNIKMNESMSRYILNNDWNLFHNSYSKPMSTWQMLAGPYRLQTGRSLYNDYKKENPYFGHIVENEIVGFNPEIAKQVGIDMTNLPGKERQYLTLLEDFKKLANYKYDKKTNSISIPLPEFIRSSYPKLYKTLNNNHIPLEKRKQYLDSNIPNIAKKLTEKHIEKKHLKPSKKLTADYLNYISNENLYKFMRKKGVKANFELPNWLDRYGFTPSRQSINDVKNYGVHYIFPGKKGDKIFEISKPIKFEEDFIEGFRDNISRPYDNTTRKRYSTGGPLTKYGSCR